MKNLLLLTIILNSFVLTAQNNQAIDSLFKVINISKIDSVIGFSYINISELYFNSNIDSSLFFIEKSLNFFEKTNNRNGIAKYNFNKAKIYLHKGEYDKSLFHFKNALELYKQNGFHNEVGQTINNIGLVYERKGDYDNAIKNYIDALKILDKIDNKLDKARVLNNIGTIYYHVYLDYNKALSYYNQVLKIVKEIKNNKGESYTYNNMAIIYMDMDSLEKAKEYYIKSLFINKELNDKYGIALCYGNLGSLYSKQKKYDEAINYYNKSLKIKNEIDDKLGMIESYMNIGSTYDLVNKRIDSEKFYLKALGLSKKIGSKDREKRANRFLSDLFAKQGKYKNAYDFRIKYSTLKDSIFNENNAKVMEELQEKYKSEKKEKEIELLTKDKKIQETELRRKELQVYVFIIVFILVLIMIIIVLRSLKQKKKANEILKIQKKEIVSKNEDLITKNEEISNQRNEIGKQHKIVLAQKKHITDSINYASYIQASILKPISYIQQLLPDSFVIFKPKDVVGGDYYWYTQVGKKALFIVADCTGHGVPGAFMTMIGNSALNQIVLKIGIENPAEILKELNKNVKLTLGQDKEDAKSDDGMDVGVCFIDTEKREVVFAGAKISLFHYINNEVIEHKGDKQSIGYKRSKLDFEFSNYNFSVGENEAFYLTSDGYLDNPYGEKAFPIGKRRFKAILQENANKSMFEQKKYLEEKLLEYQANNNQRDDINVVGFKL